MGSHNMNLISRITIYFFRFAFWFFVCLLLSFCFAILFNSPRKITAIEVLLWTYTCSLQDVGKAAKTEYTSYPKFMGCTFWEQRVKGASLYLDNRMLIWVW